MAEEQFFSMFIERLHEEVEKLQEKKESSTTFSQDIYPKYWRLCDSCEEPGYPIIACDGSLGNTPFSGGLIFWVARAVAHTYLKGTLVKATPEVGVKAGYRIKGQSFFMKTVELKTLKMAVEESLKEHGKAFAVYDGSLYFTFFHHRPHIEDRKEVLKEYVSELSSLLELGMKDDVEIIGVSKDSDITYLRTYILFEHLRDRVDGSGLYRSIKWMREKMKDVKLLDTELKEIYNDESDEAVYDRLIEEPGFTTPLLLAPQTCYVMMEFEEGRRRWDESRLRIKSPESFTPLLEEMDRLHSLPPIALTYWKPKHGLRTYRLDIPSYLLGCKVKCGDMTRDELVDSNAVNALKDLVAKLNWLDREAYGIRPLVDVDEIARLIRKRYRSSYEPVISEELRSHGFDAKPQKRSVRDDFMRRY